ncbi:MAG: hypothetical protein FJX29_15685 [Alphaproteobacteria bacterium]|nr:hypothetical protein [Alphaproteobacteria bacterium]
MSEASTAGKPAQDGGKPGQSQPGGGKPAMPSASGVDLSGAKAALAADNDRNEVFTSLVTSDDDIVGLVAYSIYKQNKHDWLVAFNKYKNREPDERELESYIIGESTARRLAIYRHLAVATLEGKGPQVNAGSSSEKFVQRSLGASTRPAVEPQASSGNMLLWIVGLIVAAGLGILAGKYGFPGLK